MNKGFQIATSAIATMALAVLALPVRSADEKPPAPLVIVPKSVLVWDADSKSITAKVGDTNVVFTFSVTNTGPDEVIIQQVQTSCGCSLAVLPEKPWHLKSGAHGAMEVHVDIRGKYGTLVKNAMVHSSAGFKILEMKLTLPKAPDTLGTRTSNLEDRLRNIHLAMADRQAVFKGSCAACHAEPAKGRTDGQELYYAMCAICHEAPNRASMVPLLAQLNKPTDKAYWRQWVAEGKPGTLMPGFSEKMDHGPLTDAQITALVDYLTQRYPTKATTPAPAKGK